MFLEVASVGAIESLPVTCDAGSDIGYGNGNGSGNGSGNGNGYSRRKKFIVDEFMH